MPERCDAVVIGGGFFGCMIAEYLANASLSVVVLEAGQRLLGRASYHNQARVHNGYHYPRSLLTARRSYVNYPRFLNDFGDCLDQSFEKYYAIGRHFSKVTAAQFRTFFERIGAPIEPAPDRVRRLCDEQLIEAVFTVRECAFDADKLAARMARELAEAQVEVRLKHEVQTVERHPVAGIRLRYRSAEKEGEILSRHVFNCTYSRLNVLLAASSLPTIPLKHERTEMGLIAVPEELRGLGITVMCGPFFSAMPFPPRGLHTLSHVRYTPHDSWSDAWGAGAVRDPYRDLDEAPKRSNVLYMLRDAARYLPSLAESRQEGSLWEIKTVLPASEADDSRPILMRVHHGLPGLHCVLGAKIDNIYDALDEVKLLVRNRRAG